MKSFTTIAALGLGVSGAAIHKRTDTPSDKCCFDIDITGGVTGPLGSLWDGQIRVGPNYTAIPFCIENSMVTDNQGRGCRVIGE